MAKYKFYKYKKLFKFNKYKIVKVVWLQMAHSSDYLSECGNFYAFLQHKRKHSDPDSWIVNHLMHARSEEKLSRGPLPNSLMVPQRYKLLHD